MSFPAKLTGSFAALLMALLIAACGSDQDTATSGAPQQPAPEQPLSAAEEHGQSLFVANCGSCHTFDAAGTQGQIGPNLDEIPVSEASVLAAIRTGGGSHSHGAGGRTGNMPRNLVTGKDAKDVAAFVSSNASGGETP